MKKFSSKSALRIFSDQAFQPLQTYDKIFPQTIDTFKGPIKAYSAADQPHSDIPKNQDGGIVQKEADSKEPVPAPAAAPESVNKEEAAPETGLPVEKGQDDVPSSLVQKPEIRENITTEMQPEIPDTENVDGDNLTPPGDIKHDTGFDVVVRYGDSRNGSPASNQSNMDHSAGKQALPEYPKCGVKGDTEADRRDSQVQ